MHVPLKPLMLQRKVIGTCVRAHREERASQREEEEGRLSTTEEQTSNTITITSSIGSADPGSIAAESELSAKPSAPRCC